MLSFPFYTFGLLGLLFSAVGIALLATSIYQLIKGEDDKDIFRTIMFIFGGSVFFLVGSAFSIGNFWSTYSFRNINISQVKRVRVIKSEDEYKNDNSNFVFYENTESIQKALATLKNCSATSRNHESYQDGYKFQIIFADESLGKDFYISVYRKSNNKEGKNVVIPHYYENKNLNLGEFSCPEFQDWIQKNIDPIFQNK